MLTSSGQSVVCAIHLSGTLYDTLIAKDIVW